MQFILENKMYLLIQFRLISWMMDILMIKIPKEERRKEIVKEQGMEGGFCFRLAYVDYRPHLSPIHRVCT
jgi:hypothetical protein